MGQAREPFCKLGQQILHSSDTNANQLCYNVNSRSRKKVKLAVELQLMEIDSSLGLHEIPKKAMQLTRINNAAEQLEKGLRLFIKNTESKVQERNQYVIKREDIGRISPGTGYEIRLERALWQKYHKQDQDGEPNFLPKSPCIIGYSVALFNNRNQANWGEIDLMGVSQDGMPIPIELKKDTGDNILKMIVQVAAYGVAVRRLWNSDKCGFRNSWTSLELPSCSSANKSMERIECICLAPEDYWNRTFGQKGTKRREGQVNRDSWESIKKLVKKFDEFGVSLTFATILLDNDLPKISGCTSIELPD
jgi:hypothetical protein